MMRRIVAVVAVLIVGHLVRGGEAPARDLSDARRSERLLQITWNPNGPMPGIDELIYRIERTILEEAAKQRGWTYEQARGYLQVHHVKLTGNTAELDLFITLPEGQKGSKEFADTIVTGIRRGLADEARERAMIRLRHAMDARDDAKEKAGKLSAEMDALREELRKITGRPYTTAEGVRLSVEKMGQEQQALELDLMAQSARRKAIDRAIALETDRLQQLVKKDPIADELAKVVRAREQELVRIRQLRDTAAASESDVIKAEATLAEAMARLLERREAAMTAAGGDVLTSWNRELLNLSVDEAEKQMRYKVLTERLDRMAEASKLLDHMEQLQAERSSVQKVLEERVNDVARLEMQAMNVEPPSLVVMAAPDSKE